ncbi:MAG: hypothetical protein QOJ21_3518, partial [Solirubrobacteraceae bacterium]|nr:hypothetical protein [Solirubrobacteraceae bacterium]
IPGEPAPSLDETVETMMAIERRAMLGQVGGGQGPGWGDERPRGR